MRCVEYNVPPLLKPVLTRGSDNRCSVPGLGHNCTSFHFIRCFLLSKVTELPNIHCLHNQIQMWFTGKSLMYLISVNPVSQDIKIVSKFKRLIAHTS